METLLNRALAGDVDAIRENIRQMIGALHRKDVTENAHAEFVEQKTLDALAKLVMKKVDREGRPPYPNKVGNVFEPIGQGITAHVQRAVPSISAPPDVTGREPEYMERAQLTFVKERPNPWVPTYPIHESLFFSPPALALRDWARKNFLGGK